MKLEWSRTDNITRADLGYGNECSVTSSPSCTAFLAEVMVYPRTRWACLSTHTEAQEWCAQTAKAMLQ